MRSNPRPAIRALLIVALLFASGMAVLIDRAAAQTSVSGRILFVRDQSLWVWSNGEATRILKDQSASDARWSPDGSEIILVRSGNSFSNLFVFNMAANTLMQVTFNQPAYEEGTPEYASESAWVMDPDWSASGLVGFMTDARSPDRTFQLWLLSNPSAGPYLAPAAQFEDNIDSLSMSRDGTLAAYVEQERQPDGTSVNRAILRDLNDGIAYPLAPSQNAFDPAIAPDQQSVAVVIRSDDGVSDIYLVSRSTGQLAPVTRGMQATKPAWSPDGSWLAFIRMIDFEFEVWATPMNAGVPGEPVKLFKARALDANSGISWTFSES